jgi:hypothetical protein
VTCLTLLDLHIVFIISLICSLQGRSTQYGLVWLTPYTLAWSSSPFTWTPDLLLRRHSQVSHAHAHSRCLVHRALRSYPLLAGHRPCRCFGSDRTPGVAPQGVFRSRTVSPTVAKWFVPDARGTMDSVYMFGPLGDV